MSGETRVLTANLGELRNLSGWARDFAAAGGLENERLDDFELCLNEALANVIVHGYHGRPPGSITIHLRRCSGGVQARIEDAASPFNPLEHPEAPAPQSIEEASIGGYGIRLMRALASGLRYQRVDGRNVLTIDFSADRQSPPRRL